MPGRPPVHPPLLSPPSKDINPGILNGGISRNLLPPFPAYSSESEVREPHINTAYSSIYSTTDQLGRRSPVRLHGSVLSTIPSASSFDDSLEVGGVSRLPRNETRSTSSLGLRPAIANSSGNKVFYASLNERTCDDLVIYNGYGAEWSPIQSVIIQVINNLVGV